MPSNTHTKVLCVEDNAANLAVIEHIFRARPDVELLTAVDGAGALLLAHEQLPDLVLLDLNLPDLSGEEVLARLKADPKTRGVPVVILSANDTRAAVERLVAHGALSYLTKPIAVDELLRAVDNAAAVAAGRAG